MKEEQFVKERAEAEKVIEPLLHIFKQTLIETYMKRVMKGLEIAEDGESSLSRLNEEADALASGARVKEEEPLVRLKRDAILKRRLKQEEFNTKVWRTLVMLNIETLGDILQVSERFYLSQRGFGKTSLNVLRDYVKRFGYELKEK